MALQTWHSIFHTDFRVDLRGFTVPALIIHGTADQNAIPALTGTPTAELVPDGVYKEYQGAAGPGCGRHAADRPSRPR